MGVVENGYSKICKCINGIKWFYHNMIKLYHNMIYRYILQFVACYNCLYNLKILLYVYIPYLVPNINFKAFNTKIMILY